jgi:hypothetical protein
VPFLNSIPWPGSEFHLESTFGLDPSRANFSLSLSPNSTLLSVSPHENSVLAQTNSSSFLDSGWPIPPQAWPFFWPYINYPLPKHPHFSPEDGNSMFLADFTLHELAVLTELCINSLLLISSQFISYFKFHFMI